MPSEETQRIAQPKEENLERRKTVKCVSNTFAVAGWVSIFPYECKYPEIVSTTNYILF